MSLPLVQIHRTQWRDYFGHVNLLLRSKQPKYLTTEFVLLSWVSSHGIDSQVPADPQREKFSSVSMHGLTGDTSIHYNRV